MSEIIKSPNEISDDELDNVSGGIDENFKLPTQASTVPDFNPARRFTKEELDEIARQAGLEIPCTETTVMNAND